MTDYLETTETGRKWRRAFHVDISNPLEGEKGVTFHAEDCVTLESGQTLHDRQGITYSQAFTPENAMTEFPLGLHPVTGEDMGTATYLQAYVLLSALFMHIASTQDAAREAAENAPPIEVPEP